MSALLSYKKIYRSYSSVLVGMLTCALVLSIGSYVYLVNKTVRNIAQRQNNQSSIVSLSNDIARLESVYMTEKHAISIDQAKAMGFIELSAADATFIGKNTIGKLSPSYTEVE